MKAYYFKKMETTSKEVKREKTQTLNLPITFSEFVKNPITGMLFLCLFAVAYMIYDTKQVTERQEERIIFLETEIRRCHVEIQKLREDNGAMRAELSLRKEYNLNAK